METILAHAQALVYTVLNLMPSEYQRDSLQSLLGLFLEAQGRPLPDYSKLKSPAALSRFLNHYGWPTRSVIREVRRAIVKELMSYRPRGKRPQLQVIVDLTSLEKTGKFKGFSHLIHVLQGKRGLHIVVLYLVVGQFRVPWGFRVWRGKGCRSAAQLAVRLMDTLPVCLKQHYQVLVLADTAFGSIEFLQAMRQRRLATVVGVSSSRKLTDGRQVRDLAKKGSQVTLKGLSFPVTLSWLYLKRNGKLVKRFVLSTRPLKAMTIIWWGRRRWAIEGFFKTAKHRFGLHRFGQQTLLGVYRWLLLSLLSFLLAHWCSLASGVRSLPDWGAAAASALAHLFPHLVACSLLLDIQKARPLLNSLGLDLHIVELKT